MVEAGAAPASEKACVPVVGEVKGTSERERRDAAEREAERKAGEAELRVEGPMPAPGMAPSQGWTGLQLRGAGDGEAKSGPELRPTGDGGLRHDAGGFTATIAADGSVSFKDRMIVQPKLVVMGRNLFTGERVKEAPARDVFADRAVNPFGPSTAAMFGGFSMGVPGLADMLLKNRYAKQKQRFLRETEAVRTRMAYAWLKQALTAELDALVSRMLAIWRDTSLPMSERRRRIFAAWDECVEAMDTPGSPQEQLRGEMAERARDRIERLVRLIAPPGSPQQFTPAELERWNAGRRSRRRFAPYAPRD
jgi:hypothetical protein